MLNPTQFYLFVNPNHTTIGTKIVAPRLVLGWVGNKLWERLPVANKNIFYQKLNVLVAMRSH